MRRLAFQMQPTLASVPSFMPMETKIPPSRAAAQIVATSGPGTRMEAAASRLNRSWLWMGARSADHTGNAGMYVSGKAISRAPFRAASPIREQAF